MANKITFQFDDSLDYQLQAVQSTVELFRGISRKADGIYRSSRTRKTYEGDPIRNIDIVIGSRLLENLRGVQLSNNLFADNALADGNNFTIEMETGTGKTYVYLRTILELNKEYGFNKFMIVVPSIAIRKGVEKSMEQLADHFKRLYNVDIQKHSFIYDSDNPKQISSKLVESNDLSICVLNIQAFNKDTNKIRKEDEYGQNLWEDIRYIKPIVIIDEPQKIEGTAKKKSKSLNDEKAKNITSYEVINGYELDSRNIFELDNISEEDFEESWRVFQAKSDRSSAMNKYYKMDSEGECEFAHRLENNSNVLLFTKLKKGGFVIDTPYGNYSPDWAVVCRKESLCDPSIGIYFVVESKWGKADANLQEVERNKIKCGKLHFEAVSGEVKFDWIKSYDDFKQKFGVAEGLDLNIEAAGRKGEGSDYILRV